MINDQDDAAVLAAIQAGHRRLKRIVQECAFDLDEIEGLPASRRADRALQRLRKQGRIRYACKTGWQIDA